MSNSSVVEIRRKRLKDLVSKCKSAAEFSRIYNLEVIYIRQLTGSHSSFGEKAARKLEEQIGLPEYYLDNEAVSFSGLSDDEKDLITLFRQKTDEGKKILIDAAEHLPVRSQ